MRWIQLALLAFMLLNGSLTVKAVCPMRMVCTIGTIAVWTYQFSQTFSSQPYAVQPYAVMAAYIINSLPVFIVFIMCQNIIMRSIILPTMT